MRVYRLLRIGRLKQRMVPYKRALDDKALPADRRIIALTEDGLDNPRAEPVIITDDSLVLFADGQIWHLGGTASLETCQIPDGYRPSYNWQADQPRRSYKCYMIWQSFQSTP